MHKSIATISSPEFINLQPLDVNPLMSSCEIKVLYIGQNRNRSYINEQVATNMAKTLRGAPIVGYYRQSAEDFGDHGEQITINGDEIKFDCLTRPYGFVAPDAKVWFQEFEDFDDFGNSVIRKYLMTTGYLWTEQFQEAKRVLEKGNNQSMELDENSLEGHWSTDINSNIDFFIIDDATFSKLCLLGEDVEPCFEGASVTAPYVSASFSKDEKTFKQTLYTMMEDLKKVLERRGDDMTLEDKKVELEEEPITFTKKEEEESAEKEKEKEDTSTKPTEEEKEEKNQKKEYSTEKEVEQEPSIDFKSLYEELKQNFDSLSATYQAIEEENKILKEFKRNVDNEKKDALINEFYMLSDEDKQEIIENKEKYSCEEIEAKLATICFRKKVSFESNSDIKHKKENAEEQNITTYNLSQDECSVPAWVQQVLKRQKEQ